MDKNSKSTRQCALSIPNNTRLCGYLVVKLLFTLFPYFKWGSPCTHFNDLKCKTRLMTLNEKQRISIGSGLKDERKDKTIYRISG